MNTQHSTRVYMQAKAPNTLVHDLNEQRKRNKLYWKSPSLHFGVFFHPPKHELHACSGILACIMTRHCGKWEIYFLFVFFSSKQACAVELYASHVCRCAKFPFSTDSITSPAAISWKSYQQFWMIPVYTIPTSEYLDNVPWNNIQLESSKKLRFLIRRGVIMVIVYKFV